MAHQTEIDNYVNPVKARLAAGEPVFGITLTTSNLDSAAQAASLGFDFMWIEMEHSPITLETLRNIVLATRGLPTVPFARVPINELWTAKRVLDQGVHGVIFPFTTTPELARKQPRRATTRRKASAALERASPCGPGLRRATITTRWIRMSSS